MTDLDRIVLQRADEQAQAVGVSDWSHEHDSWALSGPNPSRIRPSKRARCLAGDCARPVHANGYCVAHNSRVQRDGTVEDPIRVSTLNRQLRRLPFLRRKP